MMEHSPMATWIFRKKGEENGVKDRPTIKHIDQSGTLLFSSVFVKIGFRPGCAIDRPLSLRVRGRGRMKTPFDGVV